MAFSYELTPADEKTLRSNYLADDKARVVRNALTKNDVDNISRSFSSLCDNPFVFSIDIKTMPCTNQKKSGRCWIFSSMNVLREKIAAKYNIKNFELSQNFIAFYDKLEKANWFMECILDEIASPLNAEVNRFLLQNAVGDGGQWNMIQSIVQKYGICPKTAMPETYQSSNTAHMNNVLNLRLRRFAADAHHLYEAGKADELPKLRKDCLTECYSLFADCFGLPPQEFTFEYTDKDDKPHAEYHVTPLDFYHKYLGVDLDDYVSVINGPTADKPYQKRYTVKYLGNVVGGHRVELVNLPLDEFKEAALKQLKAGEVVWFGCDCSKDFGRDECLWDDKLFDYENTFDMHLSMSKADMLDSGESAMNHAMVLTGVNLGEDGKPDRWKVENSWGEDKLVNKGYYVASDSWFDKYVYVLAVNKKYLSEKALAALKEEPTVLKPWDPFGTLAD